MGPSHSSSRLCHAAGSPPTNRIQLASCLPESCVRQATQSEKPRRRTVSRPCCHLWAPQPPPRPGDPPTASLRRRRGSVLACACRPANDTSTTHFLCSTRPVASGICQRHPIFHPTCSIIRIHRDVDVSSQTFLQTVTAVPVQTAHGRCEQHETAEVDKSTGWALQGMRLARGGTSEESARRSLMRGRLPSTLPVPAKESPRRLAANEG